MSTTVIETKSSKNNWNAIGWKPTFSSLSRTRPASISFFIVGTLSFLAGMLFLSTDSAGLNLATVILMGVAVLSLVISIVVAVQVETTVNLHEKSFRRGREIKLFSDVKELSLFSEDRNQVKVEGLSFKFTDNTVYLVPLAGNMLSLVPAKKQVPLLLEAVFLIQDESKAVDTESIEMAKAYLEKI